GPVTTGTLSNPRFDADNGGPQLAGRVTLRPTPGWIVGASASRGPFVTRTALRAVLPEARTTDFNQTAWGVDLEYSQGYYLVRGEAVISNWTLPLVGRANNELSLMAVGATLEGRYKIRPR